MALFSAEEYSTQLMTVVSVSKCLDKQTKRDPKAELNWFTDTAMTHQDALSAHTPMHTYTYTKHHLSTARLGSCSSVMFTSGIENGIQTH